MPPELLDVWKAWGFDNDAQVKFLKARESISYRLLSSGFGSGKSALGCRESIDHAVRYPGSANFISRNTFKDLERSTLVTFWKEMEKIGFKKNRHFRWNQQDKVVTWWNSSRTEFTNLDDEEKFGSVEASTWFIDEGSEVADSVYRTIFPGRLRHHLPGCKRTELLVAGEPAAIADQACICPRRAWVCTNPGASGYLREVVRGRMPEWLWIPVPPGANRYNPPGYNESLRTKAEQYGAHWKARYLLGSWDSFEGQRFPMLDESVHLIDDLRPGSHHVIMRGWDFGYTNPTHVTWIAVDPRDEDPPVLVADYAASFREPKDHAAEVRRITADLGIDAGQIYDYGDPAGRQRDRHGRSYIDEYAELGMFIAPCDAGKSPFYRADHIAKFLAQRRWSRGEEIPGFLICRRAQATWESLTSYRIKELEGRMGQDPREAFLKSNDHGVDSLGYALINIVPPDGDGRPALTVSNLPPGVGVPASMAGQIVRGEKPRRSGWVDAV